MQDKYLIEVMDNIKLTKIKEKLMLSYFETCIFKV